MKNIVMINKKRCRVRNHIWFLEDRIKELKYIILNGAFNHKIMYIEIMLFKKYNRRLSLIRM